jgi:hypothetical protein
MADEAAPDDVLVVTQGRTLAAWTAVALATAAASGAAIAATAPGRAPLWWLGAALTVLGALGLAVSRAAVLRPARLTVTEDGLDLWQPFGARSLAWEEVAAIGHARTRFWRGRRVGASGVRIALLNGAAVDLPPGWQMSDDDLIDLLIDAWQGFTGTAEPAEPEG